jgi:hypothetical protein
MALSVPRGHLFRQSVRWSFRTSVSAGLAEVNLKHERLALSGYAANLDTSDD